MTENIIKIIIAGGREFDNYSFLRMSCDEFLPAKFPWIPQIVSGTAHGADKLGERYAKERGLSMIQFPADWNTYGKRAGYLRNQEMAQYADILIAFWDGKSKGTKHMIDLALNLGLEVLVKRY